MLSDTEPQPTIVFHQLNFGANEGHSVLPNNMYDLSAWVDKAPLTVTATTSCEMVIEVFVKLGVRTLMVAKNGILVGVIHKKTLLSHMYY